MHSLPRPQLEELQREALGLRFAQQREAIPMVAKLADRQGITTVDDLDAVVPLLFEHTMYKSYPVALLERRAFDKLTGWLDKLTSLDLSGVDATACDSIDGWLDALAAQAGLDTAFTSGTSGTMSFFPWSRRDLELKYLTRRVSELQRFGKPPTRAALEEPVQYVGTSNRHRLASYMADEIAHGLPDHVHLRRQERPSADLLWLASRLRLAAARGDASRVTVPESLLARRAELERSRDREQASDDAWLAEVERLQGELVLWTIFAHDLHAIAEPRVARGERWSFAPGSVLVMAGGTKGRSLPADWRTTVERFVDIRMVKAYGMTELSCFNMECELGRYHVQPWLVPFVLDAQTSAPLPRAGVQRGRAAFFDLLPESHWGGVITGDEIEVDFDGQCGCGASSPHIAPDIARLSDKRGGDDRINCAASPEAHAEAMQFLVEY
jgi:hypothetical protein